MNNSVIFVIVLFLANLFLVNDPIFCQKNPFDKKKIEIENRYDDELNKTRTYSPETAKMKKIVKDTLNADSAIFVLYSNGQVCSQTLYSSGIKNGIYKEYYSNGQIRKIDLYKNGYIDKDFEAFPFYYGKFCYFYGFKIYKRKDIIYSYDGTPSLIVFMGIYDGKKVEINIEFVYGVLFGAWIYNKKNILIKQFDWDLNTETWVAPGVNHVLSKEARRYFRKLFKKEGIITII